MPGRDFHDVTLKIIDNFNLAYMAVHPLETNSPLLIDPNAVFTLTASGECRQSISRRNVLAVGREAFSPAHC